MNKNWAWGIIGILGLSILNLPLASSLTVSVNDGQISKIGETTTINLTLNAAPNGLSGYNITVEVSNKSIAEIYSIVFPPWASLYSNSSVPADSVWIKCVDLNDQVKYNATNVTLATIVIKGKARGKTDILVSVTKIDDDNGNPISVSTISGHLEVAILRFDTGSGTYPSLSGTHSGTIKPSGNITVSKLYTYPCEGTGGHTEHARIYNESGTLAEAHWNGYTGDWHNITLVPEVTLLKGHEYRYTIRTGSYPQIIHAESKDATGGTITCEGFIDINGKRHEGWIPAIKLY